ncbi:right-handed parallel beta-helix repeat-containing protein, partial [Candidatus Woesearchaeota archaeon]|nr:right-handed parallel beta-helix repeat-containing protein [Candidatus Woesearchaeota archaeon]
MSNAPRAGIFLALLLLLPMVHGQSCTSVPTNGCDLTQDTTLILGTYFLPNGMDATTDNVRLNCNGATIRGSNVEGEHGVLGVFRTNVTVRNCRFEDYNPPSFGSGVFFAQSHFITVQDSIFEDTAFGISINGTVANDHIVIEDNLFISTRRDNLLLKANFSVARGNTFLLSTEENGLHMDGAHNLIEDNVFDSPNTQLLSFQVKNITVRRNFFRGTGETATAAVLFFPFAGGTFEDVTFVDNRVEDAYVTFGDYFSPGITHSDLTVSRNSFKDVGWVQVDFWDESVVSSNNGTRLVFGIQFAGGRNHLVQGNRLDGPGCADFANAPPPFGTNPTCNRINVIVLSAPVVTEDLTVQHNRMSDAQLGSFVVGDGGPGGLADATILNNTITNSRGGMMIQDGSGLAIEENHVDAEINDMHLTSSTVQSNTFAGDQFNVSGSGSAFIDNTLDGIAVTDTGAGHTWCVGITGNNYINGATYAGNNPGGGSCGPAGDLSVEDLDPIQVVEVPLLVRGKKGVIRSQVRWTSGRVQSTLVTLTHKLIPTGPGSPVALGSADVEVRRDTDEIVLFNFTPSVPEGNYLVSVEAESVFTESNVGNNLESEFAEVVDTDSVQVVYVPVSFGSSELGDFLDAVFAHHQFLIAVYPLSEEHAPSGLVGVPYEPSQFLISTAPVTMPILLRNLYNHVVRFGPSQPERISGIFPAGLLSVGGYAMWSGPFGLGRTVVAQDSTRHTSAHELG